MPSSRAVEAALNALFPDDSLSQDSWRPEITSALEAAEPIIRSEDRARAHLEEEVRQTLCDEVPCARCDHLRAALSDSEVVGGGEEDDAPAVSVELEPDCIEAENVREFYPEAVGAATGALRMMLDPEKDSRAHRDADILASCAVSEAFKALVIVAELDAATPQPDSREEGK